MTFSPETYNNLADVFLIVGEILNKINKTFHSFWNWFKNLIVIQPHFILI